MEFFCKVMNLFIYYLINYNFRQYRSLLNLIHLIYIRICEYLNLLLVIGYCKESSIFLIIIKMNQNFLSQIINKN